jgi:hypothetical protein
LILVADLKNGIHSEGKFSNRPGIDPAGSGIARRFTGGRKATNKQEYWKGIITKLYRRIHPPE